MKHTVSFSIIASFLCWFFPLDLVASFAPTAQLNVTITEVTPCPVKSGQLVTAKICVAACLGEKSLCSDKRSTKIENIEVDIKLLGGGFLVSGSPEQGVLRINSPTQGTWKVGTLAVGQSVCLTLNYRSGLQENVLCASFYPFSIPKTIFE